MSKLFSDKVPLSLRIISCSCLRPPTTLMTTAFCGQSTSRGLGRIRSLFLLIFCSFDDVDADIRLECVKHSKYYLVFHPEQSLEVLGWLHHLEVCIR